MILMDATPLQSEHRVRGVGTYVYYLTRELTRLYPEHCTFFVSSRDRTALPPWIAPTTVLYRPHRPAQVYWLYNEWALREALRRTQPSAFHAPDFNGVVSVPDVPTIATLHDLTGWNENVHKGTLSQRLSAWRWRVYYHEKLPKAAHIIAVSEQVKQEAVQHLDLDGKKISVIPHGVDTETLSPHHRGQGRFAGAPPYLLYMGSAEPHKNVIRLVQAFHMVAGLYPDLHLYLAGVWQEKDQRRIRELAGNFNLVRRIAFLGYVEPSDKPSLLSNALALVFVSLAEGFGLPILEAMASGVPVIASDIAVFQELAGDAALLVDPCQPDAIAEGIKTLVQSQSARSEYLLRGRLRAEQFSWAAVAQETFQIYQEVAKIPAPPHRVIL